MDIRSITFLLEDKKGLAWKLSQLTKVIGEKVFETFDFASLDIGPVNFANHISINRELVGNQLCIRHQPATMKTNNKYMVTNYKAVMKKVSVISIAYSNIYFK